jgi:hypothetical protein
MNIIQLMTVGLCLVILAISLRAIIDAILHYRKDSKKNFPLLTNLDKWAIITFSLYSLIAIFYLLYVLYS